MHMCKGAAGQRNPLMTFQADRIMGMFPAVQFVYYGTVSHECSLLYHSVSFSYTHLLGARNYRRLCCGAWQIPLCSGIVTLAGGLLVTAFCHPLLMLFSRDPAVLAFAQRYTDVYKRQDLDAA